MPELSTLSCPSCGFEYQATAASDRFECPSCRNEYLIDWSGDELSLHPIPTQLTNINQAYDARDIKKAIASTKRSITHLNKKIKETRSGTGLFNIITGISLGGLSIVIGLGVIWNFIKIADKSVDDFALMFLCGIIPLIAGPFTLLYWYEERKSDKVKFKELEAQLVQKQQELAKHQNTLSASVEPNPDRNEPV